MQPLFIATKKFGPWKGHAWAEYVRWSGLNQLEELVSLDGILCPPILGETKDAYWPHIVNEDYMLDFFIDLDFLLHQIDATVEKNLLCVYRNPSIQPVPPDCATSFDFVGYDLVDIKGGVSALSNCGGFEEAFANEELNRFGLLQSLQRATGVQSKLNNLFPTEPHADCHVWALFRAISAD